MLDFFFLFFIVVVAVVADGKVGRRSSLKDRRGSFRNRLVVVVVLRAGVIQLSRSCLILSSR